MTKLAITTCLTLICTFAVCTAAFAIDYKAEKLSEAPPKEVPAEIGKLLQPTGIKVIRGSSRTLCDIWLCKEWQVKSLKPQGDVMYPFEPGQLIGVVRYGRRGSDFRDLDISSGLYTLRYGQQPVDGNHVGTSPTRDFLLLLSTEMDKRSATLDYEALTERSAEVTESTHPALLSLQNVKLAPKPPVIRNNDEHDWWILRLGSTAKAGKETGPVELDLVIVGQAAE
ncbi:MAG: hypothetical protein QGG36_14940 [Pirellulaceae bacterium]|jgi:hypothetical protein|nr:hypothetical protein [Pirellulaceae bacterium]MDP7017100.1 hypothetical protein [Pirellulaceae bacterium]